MPGRSSSVFMDSGVDMAVSDEQITGNGSGVQSADSGMEEPNLLHQTMELARALMQISDRDPEGRPSASASGVFRHWLSVARHFTEEPQYFDDVAENYDVEGRSNKDLFDLFELLHPYVEIPYTDGEESDEDGDTPPPQTSHRERKFINLPTL